MAETTKRALAASLKKILNQKKLDSITIKDIAEDCQVQRQTFYYHFHDIYALVEWIYRNEISLAIADKKTYETWSMGFYQLFHYILANKTFVLNTYRSIKRDVLEKYIYEGSYYLLYSVVEEQSVGMSVSEEKKQFIANFYKYSFAGLLLEWISGGMKEDPRKTIENIEVLISGSIKNALTKFSD